MIKKKTETIIIKAYAAIIDNKICTVYSEDEYAEEGVEQCSIFPSRKEAEKTGYDPKIIQQIIIQIPKI